MLYIVCLWSNKDSSGFCYFLCDSKLNIFRLQSTNRFTMKIINNERHVYLQHWWQNISLVTEFNSASPSWKTATVCKWRLNANNEKKAVFLCAAYRHWPWSKRNLWAVKNKILHLSLVGNHLYTCSCCAVISWTSPLQPVHTFLAPPDEQWTEEAELLTVTCRDLTAQKIDWLVTNIGCFNTLTRCHQLTTEGKRRRGRRRGCVAINKPICSLLTHIPQCNTVDTSAYSVALWWQLLLLHVQLCQI